MLCIRSVVLLFMAYFSVQGSSFARDGSKPIVGPDLVFAEKDGLLVVEAEHFFQQTLTDERAFYLTTADVTPDVTPDGDASHVAGASGGAYLEVLPDTRRTHADRLIRGTNFSSEPGRMAVLSYKVNITTPGRYYVWVRAFSTGTEDNGLHVGLNGEWPESGQRLQWCKGRQSWRWDSLQRTDSEHCGEPHRIYLDIRQPGEHTIQFSMREDGFEFDKWLMTTNREFSRPPGTGPASTEHAGRLPPPYRLIEAGENSFARPVSAEHPVQQSRRMVAKGATDAAVSEPGSSPTNPVSKLPLIMPRQPDGDGSIQITGELKQWHKLTLTLDGPYAHEQDNEPNPFVDYDLSVIFAHESGTAKYTVPGFFAADGDAGNTSAEAGTKWRVHFAPDRTGRWNYTIRMIKGSPHLNPQNVQPVQVESLHGRTGSFVIQSSDRTGRDLRAHGRLQYVGRHYLQFAGSRQYFLKAGADAPETLLGYADFDNTIAGKPNRVPLKTWQPHLRDWQQGDPVWKGEKGKGLIGAINYLSGKGCNAISFLTYNAGGDGDNVWPFIHRDDKLHYDCSKLDQWDIVFDHATKQGMYLHFKMQETENDDHRTRGRTSVPESLDGGNLGLQRKLYCRELIARFAHNLALNWNLAEESTQTTEQQQAMIDYIADTDPYDHHIVIHTFPKQQEQVYLPLLGSRSRLTGVSLQNAHIADTHRQTVKWVTESAQSGRPWVVAFDESGSAEHGQCPDLGYRGFDGKDKTGKYVYTEHDVRHQTLWGTLLGGGAGVEYYFGYQFVENDLVCEDWRSRDRSWDYCRIAINFFHEHSVPFYEMRPADELVGNDTHDNSKYCFAKPGEIYIVYLPKGGTTDVNLPEGMFAVKWFDPANGGPLQDGSVRTVQGGGMVSIGQHASGADRVALIRQLKENP